MKLEKNTHSNMGSQKDIIPTEDHEQAIFVQWFRRTYSDVLIFSIPTGGHRHIAVATKMKVTGAVKGIPDLFCPEWRLWIEMKRTKGGVVSNEQQGMIEYLQSVGYRAIVCKGAEDAKAQILEYLNEKRN